MSVATSKSGAADARLYFIHALSPLHAGVGEGLGAVNLPTARERLTSFPYLPGTSIKGVLRSVAEARFPGGAKDRQTVIAFGPPTENAADARGGIVFSDANLLALPVRSLFGTFAWATCPYVIRRLVRDAREARMPVPALEALAAGLGADKAWLTKTSMLRGSASGPLFLLDLSLPEAKPHENATKAAAWISRCVWPGDAAAEAFFAERFVVIADDLFGFLSRTATEIRSRVKIDDETGTAADSGSWTEEHLPAETLLHGVAIGRETRYFKDGRKAGDRGEEVKAGAPIEVLVSLLASSPTLRFGGKSSTGMGRARMAHVGGAL
jgi:CRISPR-associated protein Cmr4